MHCFHLLAADKRPRAACLCWLALRQAEQTRDGSWGAFAEEPMCSRLSLPGSQDF